MESRFGAAKVRIDGTLVSGEHKGSIHQVGAGLMGAESCNGWTFWMHNDQPIDVLRDKVRAELEAGGA